MRWKFAHDTLTCTKRMYMFNFPVVWSYVSPQPPIWEDGGEDRFKYLIAFVKEEINRTSLGKNVERFYISVLWLLNSRRRALPAWGAVWPVGPEMLGSSRGLGSAFSPPCCSLAGAGLHCRGVLWLPSHHVPCWSVCPDGIYSWWAWWPGTPSAWLGPSYSLC